jgi:group I intron endonuclease
MTQKGYIYLITDLINKKNYVGATTQTVTYRFAQHIRDAKNDRKNGCSLLREKMQENGTDNFLVETLLVCNKEQLDFYENKFINIYNTLYPNGYNLKTAGNLGSKHNKLSKRKIGDAHKNKLVSEETKENIGKTSKYRNMSDENKKIIYDALSEIGITDLPMYIVFMKDEYKRFNIQVRVPNKKTKKFSKKDMSLVEKIKLAIEYKNSILT